MNAAAAIIAPAPDEARTERQLAMLQELAEIGMRLARALEAEALAPAEEPRPPSPFGGGDLGLMFTRIARAVRQTVALETRVAADRGTAQARHAAQLAGEARSQLSRRKDKLRRIVEQAIEAEAHGSEAEHLLIDLDERLDDAEDDADFADAPIADQVARLCADLGVTPDWTLWEDQDWAIAYEKSRPPDNDIGAKRWPAANPDTGDPPPDSS